MLNEIDFNWTIADFQEVKLSERWNLRYSQLLEFRQQHGHCDIPINYPENPQLGRWISKQRQKRDKLTRERTQLLEEIDFIWSAK